MNKQVTLIAALMIAVLFQYTNCSDSSFHPVDVTNTFRAQNSLNVQVGICGNINAPCTSVTVCTPGTNSCVTIPQVLVDTGSYGLRIFSSVLTVSLTQQSSGAGQLAECVGYADGTNQWGPVKLADVQLAQETAKNVPVQVIDASYASVPSTCTSPEKSPAGSGFNGILGVGFFVADCGPGCANPMINNKMYFSCSGKNCTNTTVAEAQQVTNPVALLPTDNNGVVIQFPGVSDSGAPSLLGSLTFGVGTQANNTPGSVTTFTADGNGNFKTTYKGTPYTNAFIDSGSNGIFFPDSTITACSSAGAASGFYCPSSLLSETGTQTASVGTTQEAIAFNVTNAEAIMVQSNPNTAFNNLAGTLANDFDWGFPFFIGRTIYVGIEGKNTKLGVGPYWAY